MDTGLRIATQPMFGAKERDQVHSGMPVQAFDAAAEISIDAAGTGHQRDSLPVNEIEMFIQKDFQPQMCRHYVS